MKTNTRQAAINLQKTYPDINLSTLQKWIRNEARKITNDFKTLDERQQQTIINTARDRADYVMRRRANPQSDVITRIHDVLTNDGFAVEKKAVLTRFTRTLKKRNWPDLTPSEQKKFEADITNKMRHSQESGQHTQKICYLDGQKIGTIKALHKHLTEQGLNLNTFQLFSNTLQEAYPANKQRIIKLTSQQARETLTKEARSNNITIDDALMRSLENTTYHFNKHLIGNIHELHKHLTEQEYNILPFKAFCVRIAGRRAANRRDMAFISEKDVVTLLSASQTNYSGRSTQQSSKQQLLNELLTKLREKGVDTSLAALKTRCDTIQKEEQLKWRKLNDNEKRQLINKVAERTRNTKTRAAYYWQVVHDNQTLNLNTAQLHQLAKRESQHGILSPQPFRNRLKQMNDDPNEALVDNYVIDSWSELLETFQVIYKRLPGTIYEIEMHYGEFAGYRYVGQTQTTLTERRANHTSDALRNKNTNSKRPIHRAIVSALEHADRDDIFTMTELASNVPPSKLKTAEAQYIDQLPLDRHLNKAPPGSSGGRSSTRKVTLNGELLNILDAIRIAARQNHLTEEQTTLFKQRLLGRFYNNGEDFDEALQYALDGVDGRKTRCDKMRFNVGGTPMTLEEIVDDNRFPDMTNNTRVYKLIRRIDIPRKIAKQQRNITPFLTGEIQPPKPKTPAFDWLVNQAPEHIRDHISLHDITSYKKLSRIIGKSQNTTVIRAQKWSVERFWQEFERDLMS